MCCLFWGQHFLFNSIYDDTIMKKKLSLNSFKVNSFVTELNTNQKEDLKGAANLSCLFWSCKPVIEEPADNCHVEPC